MISAPKKSLSRMEEEKVQEKDKLHQLRASQAGPATNQAGV